MHRTYVDIMIQSLKKKVQVLDKIIELNIMQKQQLEDTKSDPDVFDKTVEEKAVLIEQLEQLDSGFDKLYERVKSELRTNKYLYTAQIKAMQEYIRLITDKSMEIQAQEARNRELMTRKFALIQQRAKSVRTNTKAVNKYYKNMMQLNYVAPQFLDNKK
ncbi:MAG: flagellar export chaperone FlgN [Lachnospiraceae bacterium]|nr:flagellar export chaperone FlgN [Lachnospiraceae bacterium]